MIKEKEEEKGKYKDKQQKSKSKSRMLNRPTDNITINPVLVSSIYLVVMLDLGPITYLFAC
ncbi:protein of unknown function [Candidatus Nitrosocaldus cavascurensis]|uniref:Uncharacterized protein n=1 Tax=Candidatus Nitrosocaldus cavascurensis TaxID=2058097 RepID=A0A2K5AT41_9ARCH|nr:protein of unknown function [Candidatus Nitrosocaldus cavascurensis]